VDEKNIKNVASPLKRGIEEKGGLRGIFVL
jgi:hypothetical protein